MADIQPVDTAAGNETDDEHMIIAEQVENAVPEKYNDYGYADLLAMLRKGYELGGSDAMGEVAIW